MYISRMAYHEHHGSDFSAERPNGFDGMQLILTQSKGRFFIAETEYFVEKNTAFFIESDVPHSIFAWQEDYVDDWLRFYTVKTDLPQMDALNIPRNAPILLMEDTAATAIVSAMERINNSDSIYKTGTMHHMLTGLLLHLSSHCSNLESRNKLLQYEKSLEALRLNIYQNPELPWSLPQISSEQNLSVSYLQRLYRDQFGTSIMDDVWMSRMQHAQQLLRCGTESIDEVAVACGYSSVQQFSQLFQKFAGVAPDDYHETV